MKVMDKIGVIARASELHDESSVRALKTSLLDSLRAAGDLEIDELAGPSADHPFSLHFPEGRYLKVVWAHVV